MHELELSLAQLPELSVGRMAALPPEQLQELDGLLSDLTTWVKQARERMTAALAQRYGEAGQAALRASGRDFGVAHLTDGPLRVTYDLPKRVSWDQPKLAALAEKIAASSEKVQGYLEVEYSVPESRYNHWPPALKAQFAEARTVKSGKASFRLALLLEGGAE